MTGPPRRRTSTFLSTLSLRRATPQGEYTLYGRILFYPRSPCGERLVNAFHGGDLLTFLSTLSLRRATPQGEYTLYGRILFYPRSPCGERLVNAFHGGDLLTFLSTLSLRRATQLPHQVAGHQVFSIHALLAESDSSSPLLVLRYSFFLSTLSLRRATGPRMCWG